MLVAFLKVSLAKTARGFEAMNVALKARAEELSADVPEQTGHDAARFGE